MNALFCMTEKQSSAVLTDETVHVVRVAGVVRDGEAAVTDSHLTLSKRQREITQLIQQAAQSLRTQMSKSHQTSFVRFQNDLHIH